MEKEQQQQQQILIQQQQNQHLQINLNSQNQQQQNNLLNQQQQQLFQPQLPQQTIGRMYLLTKEDWMLIRPDKSKKQSILEVRQADQVAKFIKIFAEEFEYYFSDKVKLGIQTKIKAQVFYHRIKALKRNMQFDDNLYGVTCLFLATKLDDTLFSSDMCVQFYIALQIDINQEAANNPFAFKSLVSINTLDDRSKRLRKEKLTQIIANIPKPRFQQEKSRLLHAENDILVTLGYDFEVESAWTFVDQFVKAYKEVLIRSKEQHEQQQLQQLKQLLNKLQVWGEDIYRSNLCLYYTPIQLTLTALKKASMTEKITFPDYNGQPWWKFFNEKYSANIQSEDDIKEPLTLFNNFITILKQ